MGANELQNIRNLKLALLCAAAFIPVGLGQAHAQEATDAPNKPAAAPSSVNERKASSQHNTVKEVVVTARTLSVTRTATPPRQIPQSLSVVTAAQIEMQNDRSLDDVLNNATGITMLQGGTNNNLFYSRGFEITSIHVDGGPSVGLSNNSARPFQGLPDMGEYDHVEILRGADALFGGNGNPGAAISLVRKEPRRDPQIMADVQAGSWGLARAEVDATGPIAGDGALRGRIDAVFNQDGYYYKVAKARREKIFGVLGWDITPHTTLLVGGSYQQSRTVPNDAGLPRYPDDSDPHLPRSTAIALPWNYYNKYSSEAYAKLTQNLGGGWELRSDLTYLHDAASYAQAIFLSPIEPGANTLYGPPSLDWTDQPGHQDQLLGDITVTGHLKFLIFPTDIMVGTDFVKWTGNSATGLIQSFGPAHESVLPFNPADFPDPRNNSTLPTAHETSNFSTLNHGIYGTIRIHLTDALAVIGGARYNTDNNKTSSDRYFIVPNVGVFAGPSATNNFKDHKAVPFGGVTYSFNSHLTAYASYSDIYSSNSGNIEYTGALVPPADGVNKEVGLKGAWFGGGLNASLAVFKIDQTNIATVDYAHLGSSLPNCCYIGAISNYSKGFEVELSGKITDDWLVSGGYTYNENRTSSDGITYGAISTSTPRHLFKIWTDYRLPGRFSAWDVGGDLRLQSANYYQTQYFSGTYCGDGGPHCPADLVTVRATQGGYGILNLRAAYRINGYLKASASINNVFDTTYYSTVGIPQSSNTYGNPRNVVIELRANF